MGSIPQETFAGYLDLIVDTVDSSDGLAVRSRRSLPDLFDAAVAWRRSRTAIVQGDRVVSYDELAAMSSAAARGLERVGVVAGDVIGVDWEPTPESVATLFGAVSIGAAFMPLRDGDPTHRRRAVLADAQVGLVVACTDRRIPVGVEDHVLTTPGELMQTPHTRASVSTTATLSPDAAAYVISTSGSGGAPKGVAVPHRGLTNHILWERETFPHLPDETFIHNAPLAFDAAIWQIFTPLCVGARLALPEADDDLVTPTLRHGVTTMDFVPTQLSSLLASGELERCRHTVERVIVGGETLTAETVAAFEQSMPKSRLINVYGTTEASIDSTWQLDPFPADVITVGKPIANTRIDIVDAELRSLPAGSEGEIVIGGAGVALGYVGRPDETANRFIADPFAAGPAARRYRTGDRGRLHADGTLEFRGRSDRLVKISGRRIGLDEVDAALAACPGVAEAAAITIASPEHARLIAVVVGNFARTSSDDITEAIAARLPPEMIPGEIVVLDRLPRLPSGKVDRIILAAQVDDGRSLS